jgi:hypothetical protein
MTFQ